ncbi:MAG: hypothetical protein ABFS32_17315 [Bacteroidota bacterium]
MNIEDIFKISSAVIVSIGSAGAIIFGLSTWLGKVWANRILGKEKKQHALDIANYKSNLEQIKKEHEVIFTKLHEKRAEIIEELYGKLDDVDAAFWSLIKPFQAVGEDPTEEKYKLFVERYQDYIRLFHKKKIYFTPSVCEILNNINQILFESNIDLTLYSLDWDDLKGEHNQGAREERGQRWNTVRERYNEEVIKLKGELEENFRAILGVTS